MPNLCTLFIPATPFLFSVTGNPRRQWGGFNDGSDCSRPYGEQPDYTIYPTDYGWYHVFENGS
jgi:hypothetical protein